MKENNIVIIQGSSRSDGDTYQVNKYLMDKGGIDFIDLRKMEIGHFDYSYKNENDDFYPLISRVVTDYETIIFSTPVYWYMMSGLMKTFFDRISDLLKIHKDTGRKLRTKSMAVISCSNSNDLVHGFYIPFIESAKYLGMNYIDDCHAWVSDGIIEIEVKKNLDSLYNKIKASKPRA